MKAILRKLGFVVDGETVHVPSWRADVKENPDLAEEVARFYGYNRLATTLMRGETTRGGYTENELLEMHLGSLCRSFGYDEIITYSFISPSFYDKIRWAADDPRRESFKILNPLGEDTSIMRTTTLPSMLEILTSNYNYRNANVRLYEIGRIYLAGGGSLRGYTGTDDHPVHLRIGTCGKGFQRIPELDQAHAVLPERRVHLTHSGPEEYLQAKRVPANFLGNGGGNNRKQEE